MALPALSRSCLAVTRAVEYVTPRFPGGHGDLDLRSGAVEVDTIAGEDVAVDIVDTAVGRADANLLNDKARARYAMFE